MISKLLKSRPLSFQIYQILGALETGPKARFSTNQRRKSDTTEENDINKNETEKLASDKGSAFVEIDKKEKIVVNRLNMSPHTFWLTQGYGMERPFTGDYWFVKDLGHYECITCGSNLFSSDHKFFPPTGMASFWISHKNAVELQDDANLVREDVVNVSNHKESSRKQRCVCNKCKSHLGLVYMDGPPPTFTRFSINSGSIKFVEKGWFENPHKVRAQKKAELEKNERKSVESDFVFDKEKYDAIIAKAREKETNKIKKNNEQKV